MNLSLNFRPETPLDYSSITQIHELAFQRPNEGNLVELIRQSDRYIPELTLVAELNDRIVGHILFSQIDLVNQITTYAVLGLAPLAVHPEFQRQGIGFQLVQVSLTLAEARKEPLIVVLGEPKFYSKFGFQPAVNYKIQCPFSIPDEYFMVKFIQSNQLQYQGKISYPSVFSQV